MRWHVNCCIWLMLIIFVSGDRIRGTKNSVKRSIDFDEVADFADVVEPESKDNVVEVLTVHPIHREVRPSLFKRSDSEENEFDSGTLKVELETVRNSELKNVNDIELALKGVDDSKVETAPKKRSVSKKYSNLLDLKYYYARGLPMRSHFDLSSVKANKNKRLSALLETEPSSSNNENNGIGVENQLVKRDSHLNILPIVSAQNPYISGLADATNDAYLKMRNYAATLMVILTTTPKPEVKVDDERAVTTSSQAAKTVHDAAKETIATVTSETRGSAEDAMVAKTTTDNDKAGHVRDTSSKKRKQKKKGKKSKGIAEGSENNAKKQRKVKKDVYSFGKLNYPTSFGIGNSIPLANPIPGINPANSVPVMNNLPLLNSDPLLNSASALNSAPLMKSVPLDTIPAQSFVPAITNIRASIDNNKPTLVDNSKTLITKPDLITDAPNVIKIPNENNAQLTDTQQRLNAVKQNTSRKPLNAPRSQITTENPFLWENNLLKEANIKVKRISGPEKTVVENQGRIAADERKEIPIVTETSQLEISSKMLTPPVNMSGSSCVINKSPESEDDQCNEEEDDSDEDCGLNESGVNNTCGGVSPPVTDTGSDRRRRQANTEDTHNGGVGFQEITLPTPSITTQITSTHTQSLHYMPKHEIRNAKRKLKPKKKPKQSKKHRVKSKNKNKKQKQKKKKKLKVKKPKKQADDCYFEQEVTTNVHGEMLENLKKNTGPKVKLIQITTEHGQLREAATLSFNAKSLGHARKNESDSSSEPGPTSDAASTSDEGFVPNSDSDITSETTPTLLTHKPPPVDVDECAAKIKLQRSTTLSQPLQEITTLGFDARRLGHSNSSKEKAPSTKNSRAPAKELLRVPEFIPQKDHNKLIAYNKVKMPKEKPMLSLIAESLHHTTSSEPSPSPSAGSNATKNEDVKGQSECPTFYTVPVKQLHDTLTKVIDTINLPEQKLNLTDQHANGTKGGESTNGESTTPVTTQETPNSNNTSLEPADAKVRKEASKDQLERLRRDLFVANELQALLDKLRRETANEDDKNSRINRRKREDKLEISNDAVNFYSSQNSQYPEQRSVNDAGDVLGWVEDPAHDDKEKRFLFKQQRKKKKVRDLSELKNQNYRRSADEKGEESSSSKGGTFALRNIYNRILNFGDEKRTTIDEDDVVLSTTKLVRTQTKQLGKHEAVETTTPVRELYDECDQLVQVTESFMDQTEFASSLETASTRSTTSIYDALLHPKMESTTKFVNTSDDTMDETESTTPKRTTKATTERSTPSTTLPSIDLNDITELTFEDTLRTTKSTKEKGKSTTSMVEGIFPRIAKGKAKFEETADDTTDDIQVECIPVTKKTKTDDYDAETEVVTRDIEDIDDDYYNSDVSLALKGLTTESFYKPKLQTQTEPTYDEGDFTALPTHVHKAHPSQSIADEKTAMKQTPKPVVPNTNILHSQLKAYTSPQIDETIPYEPPLEPTTLEYNAKFHKTTKRTHTKEKSSSADNRLDETNVITVGYDEGQHWGTEKAEDLSNLQPEADKPPTAMPTLAQRGGEIVDTEPSTVVQTTCLTLETTGSLEPSTPGARQILGLGNLVTESALVGTTIIPLNIEPNSSIVASSRLDTEATKAMVQDSPSILVTQGHPELSESPTTSPSTEAEVGTITSSLELSTFATQQSVESSESLTTSLPLTTEVVTTTPELSTSVIEESIGTSESITTSSQLETEAVTTIPNSGSSTQNIESSESVTLSSSLETEDVTTSPSAELSSLTIEESSESSKATTTPPRLEVETVIITPNSERSTVTTRQDSDRPMNPFIVSAPPSRSIKVTKRVITVRQAIQSTSVQPSEAITTLSAGVTGDPLTTPSSVSTLSTALASSESPTSSLVPTTAPVTISQDQLQMSSTISSTALATGDQTTPTVSPRSPTEETEKLELCKMFAMETRPKPTGTRRTSCFIICNEERVTSKNPCQEAAELESTTPMTDVTTRSTLLPSEIAVMAAAANKTKWKLENSDNVMCEIDSMLKIFSSTDPVLKGGVLQPYVFKNINAITARTEKSINRRSGHPRQPISKRKHGMRSSKSKKKKKQKKEKPKKKKGHQRKSKKHRITRQLNSADPNGVADAISTTAPAMMAFVPFTESFPRDTELTQSTGILDSVGGAVNLTAMLKPIDASDEAATPRSSVINTAHQNSSSATTAVPPLGVVSGANSNQTDTPLNAGHTNMMETGTTANNSHILNNTNVLNNSHILNNSHLLTHNHTLNNSHTLNDSHILNSIGNNNAGQNIAASADNNTIANINPVPNLNASAGPIVNTNPTMNASIVPNESPVTDLNTNISTIPSVGSIVNLSTNDTTNANSNPAINLNTNTSATANASVSTSPNTVTETNPVINPNASNAINPNAVTNMTLNTTPNPNHNANINTIPNANHNASIKPIPIANINPGGVTQTTTATNHTIPVVGAPMNANLNSSFQPREIKNKSENFTLYSKIVSESTTPCNETAKLEVLSGITSNFFNEISNECEVLDGVKNPFLATDSPKSADNLQAMNALKGNNIGMEHIGNFETSTINIKHKTESTTEDYEVFGEDYDDDLAVKKKLGPHQAAEAVGEMGRLSQELANELYEDKEEEQKEETFEFSTETRAPACIIDENKTIVEVTPSQLEVANYSPSRIESAATLGSLITEISTASTIFSEVTQISQIESSMQPQIESTTARPQVESSMQPQIESSTAQRQIESSMQPQIESSRQPQIESSAAQPQTGSPSTQSQIFSTQNFNIQNDTSSDLFIVNQNPKADVSQYPLPISTYPIAQPGIQDLGSPTNVLQFNPELGVPTQFGELQAFSQPGLVPFQNETETTSNIGFQNTYANVVYNVLPTTNLAAISPGNVLLANEQNAVLESTTLRPFDINEQAQMPNLPESNENAIGPNKQTLSPTLIEVTQGQFLRLKGQFQAVSEQNIIVETTPQQILNINQQSELISLPGSSESVIGASKQTVSPTLVKIPAEQFLGLKEQIQATSEQNQAIEVITQHISDVTEQIQTDLSLTSSENIIGLDKQTASLVSMETTTLQSANSSFPLDMIETLRLSLGTSAASAYPTEERTMPKPTTTESTSQVQEVSQTERTEIKEGTLHSSRPIKVTPQIVSEMKHGNAEKLKGQNMTDLGNKITTGEHLSSPKNLIETAMNEVTEVIKESDMLHFNVTDSALCKPCNQTKSQGKKATKPSDAVKATTPITKKTTMGPSKKTEGSTAKEEDVTTGPSVEQSEVTRKASEETENAELSEEATETGYTGKHTAEAGPKTSVAKHDEIMNITEPPVVETDEMLTSEIVETEYADEYTESTKTENGESTSEETTEEEYTQSTEMVSISSVAEYSVFAQITEPTEAVENDELMTEEATEIEYITESVEGTDYAEAKQSVVPTTELLGTQSTEKEITVTVNAAEHTEETIESTAKEMTTKEYAGTAWTTVYTEEAVKSELAKEFTETEYTTAHTGHATEHTDTSQVETIKTESTQREITGVQYTAARTEEVTLVSLLTAAEHAETAQSVEYSEKGGKSESAAEEITDSKYESVVSMSTIAEQTETSEGVAHSEETIVTESTGKEITGTEYPAEHTESVELVSISTITERTENMQSIVYTEEAEEIVSTVKEILGTEYKVEHTGSIGLISVSAVSEHIETVSTVVRTEEIPGTEYATTQREGGVSASISTAMEPTETLQSEEVALKTESLAKETIVAEYPTDNTESPGTVSMLTVPENTETIGAVAVKELNGTQYSAQHTTNMEMVSTSLITENTESLQTGLQTEETVKIGASTKEITGTEYPAEHTGSVGMVSMSTVTEPVQITLHSGDTIKTEPITSEMTGKEYSAEHTESASVASMTTIVEYAETTQNVEHVEDAVITESIEGTARTGYPGEYTESVGMVSTSTATEHVEAVQSVEEIVKTESVAKETTIGEYSTEKTESQDIVSMLTVEEHTETLGETVYAEGSVKSELTIKIINGTEYPAEYTASAGIVRSSATAEHTETLQTGVQTEATVAEHAETVQSVLQPEGTMSSAKEVTEVTYPAEHTGSANVVSTSTFSQSIETEQTILHTEEAVKSELASRKITETTYPVEYTGTTGVVIIPTVVQSVIHSEEPVISDSAAKGVTETEYAVGQTESIETLPTSAVGVHGETPKSALQTEITTINETTNEETATYYSAEHTGSAGVVSIASVPEHVETTHSEEIEKSEPALKEITRTDFSTERTESVSVSPVTVAGYSETVQGITLSQAANIGSTPKESTGREYSIASAEMVSIPAATGYTETTRTIENTKETVESMSTVKAVSETEFKTEHIPTIPTPAAHSEILHTQQAIEVVSTTEKVARTKILSGQSTEQTAKITGTTFTGKERGKTEATQHLKVTERTSTTQHATASVKTEHSIGKVVSVSTKTSKQPPINEVNGEEGVLHFTIDQHESTLCEVCNESKKLEPAAENEDVSGNVPISLKVLEKEKQANVAELENTICEVCNVTESVKHSTRKDKKLTTSSHKQNVTPTKSVIVEDTVCEMCDKTETVKHPKPSKPSKFTTLSVKLKTTTLKTKEKPIEEGKSKVPQTYATTKLTTRTVPHIQSTKTTVKKPEMPVTYTLATKHTETQLTEKEKLTVTTEKHAESEGTEKSEAATLTNSVKETKKIETTIREIEQTKETEKLEETTHAQGYTDTAEKTKKIESTAHLEEQTTQLLKVESTTQLEEHTSTEHVEETQQEESTAYVVLAYTKVEHAEETEELELTTHAEEYTKTVLEKETENEELSIPVEHITESMEGTAKLELTTYAGKHATTEHTKETQEIESTIQEKVELSTYIEDLTTTEQEKEESATSIEEHTKTEHAGAIEKVEIATHAEEHTVTELAEKEGLTTPVKEHSKTDYTGATKKAESTTHVEEHTTTWSLERTGKGELTSPAETEEIKSTAHFEEQTKTELAEKTEKVELSTHTKEHTITEHVKETRKEETSINEHTKIEHTGATEKATHVEEHTKPETLKGTGEVVLTTAAEEHVTTEHAEETEEMKSTAHFEEQVKTERAEKTEEVKLSTHTQEHSITEHLEETGKEESMPSVEEHTKMEHTGATEKPALTTHVGEYAKTESSEGTGEVELTAPAEEHVTTEHAEETEEMKSTAHFK
ncbi:hypothetical protein Trydic_g1840, partial [Trypoxylus dichotomus]